MKNNKPKSQPKEGEKVLVVYAIDDGIFGTVIDHWQAEVPKEVVDTEDEVKILEWIQENFDPEAKYIVEL